MTDMNDAEASANTVKKRDIFFILCISIIYLVFVIAINSIFFLNHKISNIYSTDNVVAYPSNEECIQEFFIPYRTYGFYVDLYVNNDNEEENDNPINIILLDESFNTLEVWDINVSDVIDDNKVYLPVQDDKLIVGKKYYLVGYAEQESPIGIICSSDSNVGYLSTPNDGYVWSYAIEYDSFSGNIVIGEILILFVIILCYLFYRMQVADWKIFTGIYILLTVGFIFIMPFNTAFDEYGHFIRSYEVSRLRLVSLHDDIGAGLSLVPTESAYLIQYSKYERDNFKYKYDNNAKNLLLSGQESYVSNANQALYSPVSYIPQAIGIRVFSIFTKSLYWIYFGGRLFATIFNLALILLAVYLAKDYLKIIMLIVCTPVFITSMISYSADGTLNSLALFFVVYVFYCKGKEKIGNLDKFILFIGSVMLALSKVIYFPLAFLIWLIPDKALSKKTMLYKCIVSITSIAAFFVWFLIAKTYLFPAAGVDPNNQMKYMLTHIPSFIVISLKTILVSVLPWLKSLFGAYLYDSQVELNDIVWLGFGIMTLMAFVSYRRDGDSYMLEKKSERYVILGILVLIMGFTFASLYVQWTPYKNPLIEGIQGRYFIPLLYPFAIAISRKNEDKKSVFPIMIVIILLNLLAGINMYQAYV